MHFQTIYPSQSPSSLWIKVGIFPLMRVYWLSRHDDTPSLHFLSWASSTCRPTLLLSFFTIFFLEIFGLPFPLSLSSSLYYFNDSVFQTQLFHGLTWSFSTLWLFLFSSRYLMDIINAFFVQTPLIVFLMFCIVIYFSFIQTQIHLHSSVQPGAISPKLILPLRLPLVALTSSLSPTRNQMEVTW